MLAQNFDFVPWYGKKRKYESNETIDSIAALLEKSCSVYYTCHCTGQKAYEGMKNTLKDRLHYLSIGQKIEL